MHHRLLCAVALLCSTGLASAATLDSRAAAAQAAANGSSCSGLTFYWEIGDKDGNYRSGQRTALLATPVQRYTQGPIASAGKWVYATYAVEKAGGALDPALDVPFLNFTSGYDTQGSCSSTDAVGTCGNATKDPIDSANIGRFSYNAGHLEHHAATDAFSVLLTPPLKATTLDPVIAPGIGISPNVTVPNPVMNILKPMITVGLKYSGPSFAGDAAIDAGTYATMLQRILHGDLQMKNLLGANAVCASDQKGADGKYFCSSDNGLTDNVGYVPPLPESALNAVTTGTVADGSPWQYAVGHWVEKDGTFSSVGAFGFYPWIDKSKTWYGVVSRYAVINILAYQDSLVCGRAIRNAWLSVP